MNTGMPAALAFFTEIGGGHAVDRATDDGVIAKRNGRSPLVRFPFGIDFGVLDHRLHPEALGDFLPIPGDHDVSGVVEHAEQCK